MIKTSFTLLALMLTLGLSLNAQTTYYTGFDNDAELANWTSYRTGEQNVIYPWEITSFMPNSAPSALVHNYPVGGETITDDWYVSPAFDFSEGGLIDSIWNRFSGFGVPFGLDTIAIYLINGSPDPELADAIIMIHNYADSTYSNDGIWKKVENITIPAISGESYIAFRYKTIINWLDVRFDNIRITENNSTGTAFHFIESQLVDVFPNPVFSQFNIKYHEVLDLQKISILDNHGKNVKQFSLDQFSFDIDELQSGVYFIQIETKEGTLIKKIIKI